MSVEELSGYQRELGELVEKYKKEYDQEVKALQEKTHYDYK